MHRFCRVCGVAVLFAVATIAWLPGAKAAAQKIEQYRPPVAELEDYQKEPLPAGFGVQSTDVDGPVFTDDHGHALYIWPYRPLRNGDAGEQQTKQPSCDGTKFRENVGLMSPYPGGLILPDADIRPTCIEVWPPAYASDDAQKIGEWSILVRSDGKRQWAYDGHPVYTSMLDTRPGTVNGGGTFGSRGGDGPAERKPIGPSSVHPINFLIKTVTTGRLLTDEFGYSVYFWDRDSPNKSNCDASCLKEWKPVAAGQLAQPRGEWGVIERSAGVKQWTFRSRPLYTHLSDQRPRSMEGADVSGWHNAYTQKWPDPPREFTIQDTTSGQVLADKNGMTLYVYNCGEDTPDQLSCDHPSSPQAYRLAVCGNGDVALCNKVFPYVPAPLGVKINNLIWGTGWIDPQTGKLAAPNAPGAMHVWTFRDRPIYTHGDDHEPGDTDGDAWGEFNGLRNGYKAFWLRDDYSGNAG